jgi:hypothetical protein
MTFENSQDFFFFFFESDERRSEKAEIEKIVEKRERDRSEREISEKHEKCEELTENLKKRHEYVKSRDSV